MVEDMETAAPPPEESGNRMFLIGAIILGGVFIVALIGIFALYFLTQGQPASPVPDSQTVTAQYLADALQTEEAEGTQTQVAAALQTAAITPTDTPLPTETGTETPTPVVFVTIAAASDTPTETGVSGGTTPAATATTAGGAAGTAAAEATATRTRTRTPVGAATALPNTGFGDSAGFPMLIVLGGVSMIVIILSRQIRLGRNRR